MGDLVKNQVLIYIGTDTRAAARECAKAHSLLQGAYAFLTG